MWKQFVSFIEAHLSGGDHSSNKNQVSLLHGVGKHVIVNGYFELLKKHMLANCSCQMVSSIFMTPLLSFVISDHANYIPNTDQISLEMDWRFVNVFDAMTKCKVGLCFMTISQAHQHEFLCNKMYL